MPIGLHRLVVMLLELCNCLICDHTNGQTVPVFLFCPFLSFCLYFLPSSPFSLSLLRIVISLPLSQERLRPNFIHSLSFIAAPSTATYRTESLHPPGYPVAAVVLRTVIKETPPVSNIITLYIQSHLIISQYIVGILKKYTFKASSHLNLL
jgi:hypothetical protein